MSFQATVIDGQVVTDEPLLLPNGTRVEVTPAQHSTSTKETKPTATNIEGTTLGQRLMRFSGIVKDMPEDMAFQHDHYLYGTPKK